MAYDHVWDDTQPPDTQAANLLGQDIRNLKDDIAQRMGTLSGLDASKPPLENAFAGFLYFATDTGKVYQLSTSSAIPTDPGTWTQVFVVPASSGGIGSPAIVSKVDLVAQAAAIGSTILYTVPSGGSGLFGIWTYMVTSTVGTVGTAAPSFAWNDGSAVQGFTWSQGSVSAALGSATGYFGPMLLYVIQSSDIRYQVTFNSGYDAKYDIHIRCVFLG